MHLARVERERFKLRDFFIVHVCVINKFVSTVLQWCNTFWSVNEFETLYWWVNVFVSSLDGESELDDNSMVTETELPEKHSDLPAGMFTPTALPPITKGGSINNNNNNNTGKDRQLLHMVWRGSTVLIHHRFLFFSSMKFSNLFCFKYDTCLISTGVKRISLVFCFILPLIINFGF